MTKSFKTTALLATAALAMTLAAPVQAQQASANANAQAQVQTQFSLQSMVEYAGEKAAEVIAQLQAAGYQVVDVSKTLLGRIKVTVQNEVHTREIFISRATGEIKQDVVVETGRENAGDGTARESGATVRTQINIGGSANASGNGGGASAGGSAGVGISIGLGN